MKEEIIKLLEYQKKKKYSDTMMAAKAGVHTATYVRWKKEKTCPKSQAHINNIKKILEEG